jgi:integrase
VAAETDIVRWHLEDMRLRNLRDGTIYQRGRVLTRLRRTIDKPLLEAEYRDLARFLARRIQPESRAVETSHVRQFYEWAIDFELIEISPARKLRRPKVPKRTPLPIDEDDLDMAIAMAPPRIRPWYLLAGYAGLRAWEVAPLRAGDIVWKGSPPHIVIADAKGGGVEVAAMSTYLASELERCDLPLTGWLFQRLDGTPGPVPAHLVSQRANRHLRSLGIDRTFHKLRHRFGTQVLRAAGGNLRTAQDALRHASVRSTQEYTRIEMSEVSAAVEALPNPGTRAAVA